jgi:DNA-binding PadR family transcriptional regulator
VLGVLDGTPAHGFAVARTLAPTGPLGQVWAMSRPRVYRAIDDLAARGLIAPAGTAPSERGPTRTLYEVTAAGHDRLDAWLGTPVDHVREIRSDLLLKLALLDQRGASPAGLLDAQRARLEPITESLARTLERTTGFESVLLRYRLEATRSAIRFLDEVRAHIGEA